MIALTQSVPSAVEVFDFAEAAGDSDKIGALWDAWVERLYTAGLEPAEVPLRWTETTASYRTFPVELVTEYDDDQTGAVRV